MTAAQSLIGRPVAIGANRGRTLSLPDGLRVFVTVHPSSLLRLPDEADRAKAYALFVADLRNLADLASSGAETSAQASAR